MHIFMSRVMGPEIWLGGEKDHLSKYELSSFTQQPHRKWKGWFTNVTLGVGEQRQAESQSSPSVWLCY